MDTNYNIRMNNGLDIPALGLGTYLCDPGDETYNAVRTALDYDYRHIDTASIYDNEADVGRAIRDSGVPREKIFVTTKLWNTDQGYDKALLAFDKSLKELDIEYIDLFLIHWPLAKLRNESWKALEKIYRDGKVKAIGVSNFMVKHLEQLLEEASIVPAVNQIEFTPYLYQKELLDYCREKDIVVEAYSPLTRGYKLEDPRLVGLAMKYGKTPAQLLLRWIIQHDMVCLPKSLRTDRIKENADIFEFYISANDMKILSSFNEGFRVDWNPSTIP